jgi:hypothetical protein
MKRLIPCLFASLMLQSTVWPSTGVEQKALVIQTLAERRVTVLPSGELFWKIDRYSSRTDAQEATGPAPAGGTSISVVGPIPRIGSEAGHGPGVAMQVASNGATDLQALVIFVVDANNPFSSPASFPGG